MPAAKNPKVTFCQEREVTIYDNAEKIREHLRNRPPVDGGPPGHRTRFRPVVVCLGALCVLMAAGVTVLSVLYASAIGLEQQDTLGLNNTCNRSGHEVKELWEQKTALEAKIRRLQEEVNKQSIKTKDCGDGWTRFGCSCYFTSSDKRTWSEGRRECERKKSDLVVINSREEQDFVSGLMNNDGFWIGLRSIQNHMIFEWRWVDESPLTERFWADGQSPMDLFCVSCCDGHGRWTRHLHLDQKAQSFVCEN